MQYDVTLRFENETYAKQFVEFYVKPAEHSTFKVINVQAVPPLWCSCDNTRGKSYTQGKAYGWWVCPQCKRVTKMVFDRWGYTDSGFNLLPNELREYQSPEEERSPTKEWRFLVDGS